MIVLLAFIFSGSINSKSVVVSCLTCFDYFYEFFKTKPNVCLTFCVFEMSFCINYLFFCFNNKSIFKDFDSLQSTSKNLFAKKRGSQQNVFFDTSKGPVLIESGVEISGPSYLQGPLYLGSNTIVKPLTQIKNSVIGPSCKIGGEIDKVIIQANTNKVHEGHLGDAFLGEWVNLGAGTINSNLKNN